MNQEVLFLSVITLLLTTCFVVGGFALWLARQTRTLLNVLQQYNTPSNTLQSAPQLTTAQAEVAPQPVVQQTNAVIHSSGTSQEVMAIKHLAKQVAELQKKMGAVMHGMHRMTHDMKHLTHQQEEQQAVAVAQSLVEELSQDENLLQQVLGEDNTAHIVIEVRHGYSAPQGGGQAMPSLPAALGALLAQARAVEQQSRGGSGDPMTTNPDEMDIPEELKEKLRAFQAVHQAVVQRRKLPSQETPDLN